MPSSGRANYMLGVLVLSYLVSYLDRQIMTLLIGPISEDLGLDDFQVSLLAGFAFALFFCLLGLPLGRMADRFTRKWLIISGILLWSAMTALCGLADSFPEMFLARMGVGVGEAALAPAAYSLISDSFKPERLVRATSVFAMGALLGIGTAFLWGGSIISLVERDVGGIATTLGLAPWRAAFILVALPGVLVAALGLLVKEPRRQGAGKEMPSLAETLGYLRAHRRDFLPIYACGGLLGIVTFGGLSWFPTHLIRTFGAQPSEVGLALGAVHVGAALLGAALGPWLTEYLQRRGRADAHLVAIGMLSLLAFVGLLAPLMPSFASGVALWSLCALAQSSYYGCCFTALQLLTPNRMRALNAAGFIFVVNMLGLGFGASAIAAWSQFIFPQGGIGAAIALICGVSALLSALIAWRSLPSFATSMRQRGGGLAARAGDG